MKRHLEEHPKVRLEREIQVVTETLDNLLGVRKVSFLNLDIQGAELHALEGFCEGLPFTEVISSEVNFIEIYENCPMVGDLDDFLATYGFQRILTRRRLMAGETHFMRRPHFHGNLGGGSPFCKLPFQSAGWSFSCLTTF
jgi:hypothetical protein